MGDSCRCRGGLPYDRVRVRVNSVMVRVCVMFSISIIVNKCLRFRLTECCAAYIFTAMLNE